MTLAASQLPGRAVAWSATRGPRTWPGLPHGMEAAAAGERARPKLVASATSSRKSGSIPLAAFSSSEASHQGRLPFRARGPRLGLEWDARHSVGRAVAVANTLRCTSSHTPVSGSWTPPGGPTGLGVCPLTCLDVAPPAGVDLEGEQGLVCVCLPTGEAESPAGWASCPPPPRAGRTKEDGDVKVLFLG